MSPAGLNPESASARRIYSWAGADSIGGKFASHQFSHIKYHQSRVILNMPFVTSELVYRSLILWHQLEFLYDS